MAYHHGTMDLLPSNSLFRPSTLSPRYLHTLRLAHYDHPMGYPILAFPPFSSLVHPSISLSIYIYDEPNHTQIFFPISSNPHLLPEERTIAQHGTKWQLQASLDSPSGWTPRMGHGSSNCLWRPGRRGSRSAVRDLRARLEQNWWISNPRRGRRFDIYCSVRDCPRGNGNRQICRLQSQFPSKMEYNM